MGSNCGSNCVCCGVVGFRAEHFEQRNPERQFKFEYEFNQHERE